jgi:hypothetical protein
VCLFFSWIRFKTTDNIYQGYFSRSTHISSKITIDLVNPADLTSLSLVFLF